MLEPLGQSQVVAYLEKLARAHEIHLLSFEKKADREDNGRMRAMRERLAEARIRWSPLSYHKSPSAPATAYDIAIGTAVAVRIARSHRIGIVHARSYVAGLIALGVKRATGACFLFDIRGFWADERVDGGIWPRDGRLYRMAKRLERSLFLAADHVVTLTEASTCEIARIPYLAGRMPPLTVIPTCADLERFKPLPVDPARPFTFGYVGSIGTWYMFDETLQTFGAILRRRPDARLLIVNRNEHEFIRAAVARAGIGDERLELTAADHGRVPEFVARMHVAGALIVPSYSKIASAPTKLGEYLGCGVPCLGNAGVGDMEETLEGNRVGVALTGFSTAEIESGADRLLALAADRELSARCRATAERLFSLERGVDRYDGIYRDPTGRRAECKASAACQ